MMSKRGELKNLSKIIEDVFSQKEYSFNNIRNYYFFGKKQCFFFKTISLMNFKTDVFKLLC